ncbi:hypothetical protein SmJEL517_g05076 [Synchytrium microbalum]|uniref:HIT domain-containing protein n=1 Tax=Synchytrium microbalum TaxID=1806994 RepID=A0A507C2B8_9FUNG|nr:uncharacterized protein SmJEL517_g05076 [Synchytrium microbalum]TPX31653.1 hypothetical protein SmJEL517_g05076 [Synchytrium microbalum]
MAIMDWFWRPKTSPNTTMISEIRAPSVSVTSATPDMQASEPSLRTEEVQPVITRVANCTFCNIIERKIPAEIVFENDELMAFRDISPSAQQHLLIVPKTHIGNISHLGCKDAPLLERMEHVGEQLLSRFEQKRFGFHSPPFYTVDHLHLHALGLPFINRFRAAKYMEGSRWFITNEIMVESLRKLGPNRTWTYQILLKQQKGGV